ncbi:hypothetical protein RND71_030388 [Anisodus tanguticus]|uniref:Uncharacterized protein n=1 Tax=Anisodus tanguticus TaxID=243964 RepID=A0AAE1RGD1_9SOLA|nr:hypothetical protein RND71_030388 [Anisodus tanguticus]
MADLKDGDEFDVYVIHGIHDLEFIPQLIDLLVGPDGDPTDEARATHVGKDINTNENETQEVPKEAETNLNGGQTDLNGDETNLNGDDPDFNIYEHDIAGDESNDDAIPDVDDSYVHEELKSLRNEKRSKKNANSMGKIKTTEEIPLGESGIDRGFEDIERNKSARYVCRLGGDEDFIYNLDCGSEDEIDVDVVNDADIPTRMKSTKVRYDPDCVVTTFELGIIFENEKVFRKALTDYQ